MPPDGYLENLTFDTLWMSLDTFFEMGFNTWPLYLSMHTTIYIEVSQNHLTKLPKRLQIQKNPTGRWLDYMNHTHNILLDRHLNMLNIAMRLSPIGCIRNLWTPEPPHVARNHIRVPRFSYEDNIKNGSFDMWKTQSFRQLRIAHTKAHIPTWIWVLSFGFTPTN